MVCYFWNVKPNGVNKKQMYVIIESTMNEFLSSKTTNWENIEQLVTIS